MWRPVSHPCSTSNWVQGLDLNQRPSGYEPDELPGCSTLQQRGGATCVAPICLSTPFWFLAHFALASGWGDPCFGPLCQLAIINHNLSRDRKAAHWPTCVSKT